MERFYYLYLEYFEMIILGIAAIAIIFSAINIIKIRRLTKKYNSFMKELSEHDIEKLLIEHTKSVDAVTKETDEIKKNLEEIRNLTKQCFQKYGVVRYTAFDDVGSDLSFAIALLDGNNDGVILNGIYSREGSAVYAKPIHKGETKHHLSEEEQKALENAKRKGEGVR